MMCYIILHLHIRTKNSEGMSRGVLQRWNGLTSATIVQHPWKNDDGIFLEDTAIWRILSTVTSFNIRVHGSSLKPLAHRKKLTWKQHREILLDNVLLCYFVEITVERGRDRRTVIARCVSPEARTTRPIQGYLSTPGRYTLTHPPKLCHNTRTAVALEKGPKKPTFPPSERSI